MIFLFLIKYKFYFFIKNHFYYYLSKLIKNAENLKSLILRIHPNNFNNNIYFFLSLIEDLNKLKNFNIIENCEEPKYYNYKFKYIKILIVKFVLPLGHLIIHI